MHQDGRAVTWQLRPVTLVSLLAAAAVVGWISATVRDRFSQAFTMQKNDNHSQETKATSATGNDPAPLSSKEHLVRKFETIQEEMNRQQGSLRVRPIGTVRSIYQLCVGTPRQGLLAPDSRGRIELAMDYSAAMDATIGLQDYSHIWIVFLFHLNTVRIQSNQNHTDGQQDSSNQSKNSRVPLKIAPPALGGTKKVGVLATRSPHRINPIGITLARLEDITILHTRVEGRKKPVKTVSLQLSGLDLVDGTPVLDVKPYVPVYDAPLANDTVRLPDWVTSGLATRRKVQFSDQAVHQLQTLLEEQPQCLEFYKVQTGDTTASMILKQVLDCIKQVLSMDVRSTYQTKKARRGASHAERAQRMQECSVNNKSNSSSNGGDEEGAAASNTLSTQQIDNLLVSYRVMASNSNGFVVKHASSVGSGAEDSVLVESIALRP